MEFEGKTTDELVDIAFSCLSELQKRSTAVSAASANVVFKQAKDALVYDEQQIPADRKGWLYLPFLEKWSLKFQPIFQTDGKIYRKFFSPGTKLELSGKEGKKSVEILHKGPLQTVKIGGAFVTGPLKIIQKEAA